ncbi:MAG: recombination mediator RecR [Endomicrobiia bacterium]
MEKSRLIQEIINLFKTFPSVGPKTAERFVYHLLNNQQVLEYFTEILNQIKEKIVKCQYCNDFDDTNPCKICSDSTRDTKILCIVEKHQDIYAIETAGYKGLYYILSSIINPLEGKTIKDINLENLIKRITDVSYNMKPQEIIIATSFTTEGELTANYIAEFIKSKNINIKISRIAKGLPTGAEIEYSDPKTLSFALKNRTIF